MLKKNIKISGIIIIFLIIISLFRYNVVYKENYQGKNVKLKIYRFSSHCFFCNTSTHRSDIYYYKVTKGNNVLLKYRLQRETESQWYRARAGIVNDTLKIEHGDGYHMFVLNIPLFNDEKYLLDQILIDLYQRKNFSRNVTYYSIIDDRFIYFDEKLLLSEVKNILNKYLLYDVYNIFDYLSIRYKRRFSQ